MNNKQERGFIGFRLKETTNGVPGERRLGQHGIRQVPVGEESAHLQSRGQAAEEATAIRGATAKRARSEIEVGEKALSATLVDLDGALKVAHKTASLVCASLEEQWRAKVEVLEGALKEAQGAASREAAKYEAREEEQRAKTKALEGALREAREAASREAADYEAREAEWRSKAEALERALKLAREALAEGEAWEEAHRAGTVTLEGALKEAWEAANGGWRAKADALLEALKQERAKCLAKEAVWQSKMRALEGSLKEAEEAALQARACKERALADKRAGDVAWSAQTTALERALDESQKAASQALARVDAWQLRAGSLERTLNSVFDAATRASEHALREREEFWRFRYDRLLSKSCVLKEEKDRIEKDLLAYTLCGIRDPKDMLFAKCE